MNQLIPQNLNRPWCINRNAHVTVLHAIDLDSDSIAQELMQRLFGISTWSDVDHNGLADTTSEY
ncbi:hypothetical protein AU05_14885 [Ectopseudomonas composti]|uniref:Uncharacterized protein n=1 Tax=Ectopseudomonas composti TaxID=658457 RepID=A0ABP3BWG6_9GAMM|nr:hypothetical protein AU05_14885 [Pseudomonas composti]